MNTVLLPGPGRRTSQLAFGSSRLMGASGMRESLAFLETAFDAGIRHFDTAPSYGMGQAELCMGRFLGRHKGAVTVTTKYGIAPPKKRVLMPLARRAAGTLIRVMPSLKSRLQRAAASATGGGQEPSFNVAAAQTSLENSLRELQVDHIDVWLLHEAGPEALQDESLLRFMEDCARAGKVGTFGIGSAAEKIAAIGAGRLARCPVVQCEWSPLAVPEQPDRPFRIFHQVLRVWHFRLMEHLKQDVQLLDAWSQATDADLNDGELVARLLMKAALLSNPRGIILFSSKKKRNILSNAQVEAENALLRPAQVLLELLRREAVSWAV